MNELGPPISYLALREGTPVYDRHGERVGVVEEVVADGTADIFKGVAVHTLPLPGHHLFADANQIAELYERGVVLTVERDALRSLVERPGAARSQPHDGLDATVDDPLEPPLQSRLRRAWDRLAGRR